MSIFQELNADFPDEPQFMRRLNGSFFSISSPTVTDSKSTELIIAYPRTDLGTKNELACSMASKPGGFFFMTQVGFESRPTSTSGKEQVIFAVLCSCPISVRSFMAMELYGIQALVGFIPAI